MLKLYAVAVIACSAGSFEGIFADMLQSLVEMKLSDWAVTERLLKNAHVLRERNRFNLTLLKGADNSR